MPISALGTFFTTTSGPGTFVAQQAAITAFSDTGPLIVRRSPAAPRTSRLALTSGWSQLARPSAFPLVRKCHSLGGKRRRGDMSLQRGRPQPKMTRATLIY